VGTGLIDRGGMCGRIAVKAAIAPALSPAPLLSWSGVIFGTLFWIWGWMQEGTGLGQLLGGQIIT
jgi:hypothetical protein